MNRLLIPVVIALAVAFAGCASDSRAAGPEYSRDEVRSWSKDHVVVLISRRNGVRLNNEPVKPAELPGRLARLGDSMPGRPVIVLLQPGGDERAIDFVRRHAGKAGLGPVEVR